MAEPANLYQQVVRITYVYLGPAADRFVTRQVVNHLRKSPEELRPADMPELIDWIKLAMGFLTEDQKLIDDYIGRLRTLDAKPARKLKSSRHAIEAA